MRSVRDYADVRRELALQRALQKGMRARSAGHSYRDCEQAGGELKIGVEIAHFGSGRVISNGVPN